MTTKATPNFLGKAQVSRRLGLAGTDAFETMWTGLVASAESRAKGGDGMANVLMTRDSGGAWYVPEREMLALQTYASGFSAPKTAEWLNAADLKNMVPGDCEKLAGRVWARLLDLSKDAQGVLVDGKSARIERRRSEGGKSEICLHSDSFPGFMKVVQRSRQKQIEQEVASAMGDSRDGEYASPGM